MGSTCNQAWKLEIPKTSLFWLGKSWWFHKLLGGVSDSLEAVYSSRNDEAVNGVPKFHITRVVPSICFCCPKMAENSEN